MDQRTVRFPNARWSWTLMTAHEDTGIPRVRSGGNTKLLQGFIVYSLHPDTGQQKMFYRVDESELLTLQEGLYPFDDEQEKHMLSCMDRCRTALQGFCILIGEVALTFLSQMEELEWKLEELEGRMKRSNDSKVLDEIMDLQYEVLDWHRILQPLEEFHAAAKGWAEESPCHEYDTNELLLQRLHSRLNRYRTELDILLNIDNNIATYRGNEIMKTLTVFSVVCTPATVFGSIWGMNFKYMPELELPFGYALAILAIVLLTLAVYFWMRWKGWTGDLLKGKNKDSNII